MHDDIKYGEIKTKKNIFPKDAKEIINKGTVRILVSQCPVSLRTKEILSEGNIILYDDVEPNEVYKLREIIKERLLEKQESEKRE